MNSKGVTPIVATMLLMVIAVGAVASASVFLEGTLQDVQDGLEDQLQREDRIESSDITVETVYQGNSGFILADVRNSGSVTLEIEENSNKLWNLYIDGRPQQWTYVDTSKGGDESLNPNGVVSINTTTAFPAPDSSKEVRFNAPYETSDSYVCFNEGGLNC